MQTEVGAKGKIDWGKLVISLLLPLLVGLISSFFTRRAGAIYQELTLPAFAPPGWVFAPVWTVLYLLMGWASYRIWRQGLAKPEVRQALTFYLVQLFFNFLWSVLFFGLQWRGVAFLEILVLLVLIVITTLQFWKIDKTAGYLMIPYLIWVAFATVLNFAVWQLNP